MNTIKLNPWRIPAQAPCGEYVIGVLIDGSYDRVERNFDLRDYGDHRGPRPFWINSRGEEVDVVRWMPICDIYDTGILKPDYEGTDILERIQKLEERFERPKKQNLPDAEFGLYTKCPACKKQITVRLFSWFSGRGEEKIFEDQLKIDHFECLHCNAQLKASYVVELQDAREEG